jgi:hypothetical protein
VGSLGGACDGFGRPIGLGVSDFYIAASLGFRASSRSRENPIVQIMSDIVDFPAGFSLQVADNYMQLHVDAGAAQLEISMETKDP